MAAALYSATTTSATRQKVGLVDHAAVGCCAAAIQARMADLAQAGVAIGLPANFGITPRDVAGRLPAPQGRRAIVSGSCSVATNAQVADFRAAGGAPHAIDPFRLLEDPAGACVQALEVKQLRIGPQTTPCVPVAMCPLRMRRRGCTRR